MNGWPNVMPTSFYRMVSIDFKISDAFDLQGQKAVLANRVSM